MPRFEKWLTAATPDAPADSVARIALAERLVAVRHFLEHALGGSDEAEQIHQLRVWTRRASAALKLFEPALPSSQAKKMKKLLRKLRRTAGDIRDCDIQLQRFRHQQSAIPKRVIREILRERRHARQKLKEVRSRLRNDSRMEKLIERLLEKIGWPKRHSSRDAPSFSTFCRHQLRPLADEFFNLAEADLNDTETLHALRIAGKRLRYALELAPAAMPAREHRQLCASLNKVQDRLGDVCDQLAAIDHVQDGLNQTKKKKHRRLLDELLQKERRRLDKSLAKLIRWWPQQRRRLHQQWQKVL
jgi:CHAD domain-containing protein